MKNLFNLVSPFHALFVVVIFMTASQSSSTMASFVDDRAETASTYPVDLDRVLASANRSAHRGVIDITQFDFALQRSHIPRFPFATIGSVDRPMSMGMGVFQIPGFSLEDRLALLNIRIEFLQNLSEFIRSKIAVGVPGDDHAPLPTPLPPAILFALSGLLMLGSRLRKCGAYLSRVGARCSVEC